MPARDYELAVTGLTNSIWICKPSKRHPGTMTDDRVKVDESHFIGIVMEWANGKIDEDSDTLEFTVNGKRVGYIKIDRVALGLKKPPRIKKKPNGNSESNGAIATGAE